jgi:hypothetical protein
MSDGGTTNPYALTITSGVSGRRGELMVDSGNLDLGLSTITRPRDAVVTVGQSGGGSAMLITNSTNTLKNVIPGVTLNLLSESDSDITVTTDQDIDSMVTAMQEFTDAYNDAQEAIDKNIAFDQETKARGPLLGDSTVSGRARSTQRSVVRSGTWTPGFASLVDWHSLGATIAWSLTRSVSAMPTQQRPSWSKISSLRRRRASGEAEENLDDLTRSLTAFWPGRTRSWPISEL